MHDLLRFLAQNKKLWIPPILIFVGLLVWLATTGDDGPAQPFGYRPD